MIHLNIKKLRKHLKMTQAEFANTIGIKGNTLSVIEAGGTVTEQNMTTICAVHNVNRDWLETGKGPMFREDAPATVTHEENPSPKTAQEQALIEKVLFVMGSNWEAEYEVLLRQSIESFYRGAMAEKKTRKPGHHMSDKRMTTNGENDFKASGTQRVKHREGGNRK